MIQLINNRLTQLHDKFDELAQYLADSDDIHERWGLRHKLVALDLLYFKETKGESLLFPTVSFINVDVLNTELRRYLDANRPAGH